MISVLKRTNYYLPDIISLFLGLYVGYILSEYNRYSFDKFNYLLLLFGILLFTIFVLSLKEIQSKHTKTYLSNFKLFAKRFWKRFLISWYTLSLILGVFFSIYYPHSKIVEKKSLAYFSYNNSKPVLLKNMLTAYFQDDTTRIICDKMLLNKYENYFLLRSDSGNNRLIYEYLQVTPLMLDDSILTWSIPINYPIERYSKYILHVFDTKKYYIESNQVLEDTKPPAPMEVLSSFFNQDTLYVSLKDTEPAKRNFTKVSLFCINDSTNTIIRRFKSIDTILHFPTSSRMKYSIAIETTDELGNSSKVENFLN